MFTLLNSIETGSSFCTILVFILSIKYFICFHLMVYWHDRLCAVLPSMTSCIHVFCGRGSASFWTNWFLFAFNLLIPQDLHWSSFPYFLVFLEGSLATSNSCLGLLLLAIVFPYLSQHGQLHNGFFLFIPTSPSLLQNPLALLWTPGTLFYFCLLGN